MLASWNFTFNAVNDICCVAINLLFQFDLVIGSRSFDDISCLDVRTVDTTTTFLHTSTSSLWPGGGGGRHFGADQMVTDILLSPVTDLWRGGEHLLHPGVLDHGAVVAVGDTGDGGEAGVIMNNKYHSISFSLVTNYFLQSFRSWYFSGFFNPIVNKLRFLISC